MTTDPRTDTVARVLHDQRERRTAVLPNYERVSWERAPEHVKRQMREAATEIVRALDEQPVSQQQEES